jgi:hypothetical protein
LDRGIERALLSRMEDKKEQLRRFRLYLVIKLIYIDRSLKPYGATIVFNVALMSVHRAINKAISLITGCLNS